MSHSTTLNEAYENSVETNIWPRPKQAGELLRRHYGAQTDSPFLALDILVPDGALSAFNPTRLQDINRFVTSGFTPSGDLSGYKARERIPRHSSYYRQDYTANIQVCTSLSCIYKFSDAYISHPTALIFAVHHPSSKQPGSQRPNGPALQGRQPPDLSPGPHLHLAEHGIVLTSSFHVYRAYVIVSARFHPGNESNSLDPAAHADAVSRLVRYLRRRAVRRVPDAGYIDDLAETVRQLPVVISHVEDLAARLRGGDAVSLHWAHKILLRWTFPEFTRGRAKLR
ncbi:unnamed protein product [Mycena citricolor]|uniref:Uncharacterized protein n=1 Tax=Mycena citricolor TaxID=2018698 RepID=A0AAD2K5F3_9AGAR|nr:unnamed protein product [Mycena citricolor]